MSTLTPRQAAENLGFPFQDHLVCTRRRFVVCAIPKNGCSNLKRWFLSGVDPLAREVADVHEYCRSHHALSLLERPDIARALDEYFCFAFVRDPLKRIASAYAEKFVGLGPHELFEPAREMIEELHRRRGVEVVMDSHAVIRLVDREYVLPASMRVDYSQGLSFRAFVDLLTTTPDEHLDVHFKPQSSFIEGRRLDFLGRVEHLSSCLPELSQLLDMPEPPVARHAQHADIDYQGPCLADVPSGELTRRRQSVGVKALYDDDLRRAVLRRYEQDVLLYLSARAVPGTAVAAPIGSLVLAG